MEDKLDALVEAIKDRHSVRSYLSMPIEPEKVEKLRALIDKYNEEGDLGLAFCENAGKTFSLLFNKVSGLGSAPSVIVCKGKDEPNLEEKIGYYGQKIVLYAQTIGLNTCWVGTFNKKNLPAMIRSGERVVIAIAIGYGSTPGKPHKSKSMEQILISSEQTPSWFDFGVDMALLAPTALNQQKFKIGFNSEGEVVFQNQGGPYSKVDLGIVRCNFEIGAEYKKSQQGE